MTETIAAIIGAVIASAFTWWMNNRQTKVRLLEYRVLKSANFLQSLSSTTKLEFKVGDRIVNNVGLMEVSVYNRTDANYDSIDIEITITSITTVPVTILDFDFKDVKGKRDRINLHPFIGLQTPSNTLRYTISHVNKGNQPILCANFVLQDIDSMECTVDVKRTGLDIKKLDVSIRKDTPNVWLMLLGGIVTLASGYVLAYALTTEQGFTPPIHEEIGTPDPSYKEGFDSLDEKNLLHPFDSTDVARPAPSNPLMEKPEIKV